MAVAEVAVGLECHLPRGPHAKRRTLAALCVFFLTVLEDTLHVEAVGGARLVVSAPLEVVGQLAGPAVVDHPRVRRADGIWEKRKEKKINTCSSAIFPLNSSQMCFKGDYKCPTQE